MVKFALSLPGFAMLGFGMAIGGVAMAQSTNPTGAISRSTNPTGAVGNATPAAPGQPFLTQRGPAVGLGGNPRSEPLVMPNGGIGTATQNGNGTTTITRPNGGTEIVHTPR